MRTQIAKFTHHARRRVARLLDPGAPKPPVVSAPANNFEAGVLDAIRAIDPPALCQTSRVTDALTSHLSAADFARIEAVATEEQRGVLQSAASKDQGWVRLAIAASHRLDPILAKARLSSANPPDDVHSMSRSWLGCGGSMGHADMIIDSLLSCGEAPDASTRVLDFGCSSGRVIRVLHAGFPDWTCHGCDPNTGAVAWASANLPGVNFFASKSLPPLPLADGSLDLAYAISIWSHFNQASGLRWLEEMHRVLRPGGRLLMTTHGWHSLKHYDQTKARPASQLAEVARTMMTGQLWFAPEFGAAGDHGVVDSNWGTAFFDPRWCAVQLTSRWQVAGFFPGRECGDQDVYVLVRR
ncbi:MAG: class I SAM-dependent methyltransferase [Kofleriaceae bacterium]|nr:class I SAM-dependent methyltransferase [Kofleriaceae bacterium]